MATETAYDLAQSLNHRFDPDKRVLVDTGDGIFTVAEVREESHEIFIVLGPMP